MKRLGGAAALAVAAAARPGNGQPVYRLESAVTLKGIASDGSTLTLDSARGYLFIGRRGVGVTVFDVHAQKTVWKFDLCTDANAVTLYAPTPAHQRSKSSGRSSIGCPCTVRSAA